MLDDMHVAPTSNAASTQLYQKTRFFAILLKAHEVCCVCVCVRSASSFACNNFSSSILFFISVLKWKKNMHFFPGLVVLRKILSFIHIHRKFVHIFMFYLFFSSWLCTRLLLFWLLFFFIPFRDCRACLSVHRNHILLHFPPQSFTTTASTSTVHFPLCCLLLLSVCICTLHTLRWLRWRGSVAFMYAHLECIGILFTIILSRMWRKLNQTQRIYR